MFPNSNSFALLAGGRWIETNRSLLRDCSSEVERRKIGNSIENFITLAVWRRGSVSGP